MITIQQNPTLNSHQQTNHKNITEQSTTNHNLSIKPNHFSQSNINNHKLSSPINPQQHKKKLSPPKKTLPIKEFLYGSNNLQVKKRTQSQIKLINPSQINTSKQNLKRQLMPIKIVKDKIQHQENTKTKNHFFKHQSISSQRTFQNQENPQNLTKSQRNFQNPHFLTTGQQFTMTAIAGEFKERQKAFKPKLSLFQRFNYENYQNYSYKNPYKLHQQHSIINRNQKSSKYKFPTTQKYQIHKGSQKNLQIIFCESKYPQFVQKTNEVYEKFNQNKSQSISKFEFLSRNQSWIRSSRERSPQQLKKIKNSIIQTINNESRRLLNTKNATQWNYQSMKTQPQKINCVHTQTKILYNQNSNPKSTLEKLLNEFKTLQKLTLLQQKEQQTSTFNRFRTETLMTDHSKTVLIGLIIHKFPFLQNLTKSLRNHLFKSIFDQDSFNQSSKISIHGYLKFNRIFISKDATLEEISIFIIRFLFKNSSSPSLQLAEKILNQLNSNKKKKLHALISFLYSISIQNQISYETIITKFLQNPQFMILTLQLIKNE